MISDISHTQGTFSSERTYDTNLTDWAAHYSSSLIKYNVTDLLIEYFHVMQRHTRSENHDFPDVFILNVNASNKLKQ